MVVIGATVTRRPTHAHYNYALRRLALHECVASLSCFTVA